MLLLLLSASVAFACAANPNVVFVVIDDLGWDDVGFRSHQINTPTIDGLAADGIILNNYYVQCVCSPSRAVFATGRYPVHNTIYDWIHPDATYGLPINETTHADKFLEAGYDTHAVGKWHLGFFKPEYTPTFRGFNSFYGFYSGGEDYFKHVSSGAYDFRRDPSPKCGPGCSKVATEANGNYSTDLFSAEAVHIVENHDMSKPLFLYLAYQGVHAPSECPQHYIDPYNNTIQNKERRTFAGMLSAVDQGIGNVTAALKAKGMLDNTLIVVTTDNGGPTTTGDGVGARNWPLRGGKHTIWEGGTRGTAFINGPMLQKTKFTYDGMMHAADWLPTLITAAGLTPGGTLPLDGVDQWDALNTNGTSPRTGLFYGNNDDNTPESWGIRDGKWKLLQYGGGNPDTWYPPVNASSPVDAALAGTCTMANDTAFPGDDLSNTPAATAEACCDACLAASQCAGWTWQPTHTCTGASTTGCCYMHTAFGKPTVETGVVSGSGAQPLPPTPPTPGAWQLYDLDTDPTEHNDVSAQNPDVVASLKASLEEIYNNRVPLVPDSSCPPVKHPVDPTVGPVWAPWC